MSKKIDRNSKLRILKTCLNCDYVIDNPYVKDCDECGLTFSLSKPTYKKTKEEIEYENKFALTHLEDEVYAPGKKAFAKPGAWVMLIRVPHFSPNLKQHLKQGQIFWAEHVDGSDEYGFNSNGKYKIVVKNKWHDFCLFPYEYSVQDESFIFSLVEAGELEFFPLKGLDVFNEQVFYARSRGMNLETAIPMVLGTVKAHVGHFAPNKNIQKQIDATFSNSTIGIPILLVLKARKGRTTI